MPQHMKFAPCLGYTVVYFGPLWRPVAPSMGMTPPWGTNIDQNFDQQINHFRIMCLIVLDRSGASFWMPLWLRVERPNRSKSVPSLIQDGFPNDMCCILQGCKNPTSNMGEQPCIEGIQETRHVDRQCEQNGNEQHQDELIRPNI